jgi:small subunit ribosomal protein S2
MLDAGIHFGSNASRWNPKMRPFIYGKRNALHIIDIRETLRGILRAQKFLTRVVSQGDDVLFVGTKRQAREPIQSAAERCQMHYVNERWLGGTLTNFRTIRSRLQRLEELENLVSSPQWESDYSKKMQSTLSRELHKIRRNLSGIRKMTRLPGALVVIDMRKEINALREAQSLHIPTVCLIDTDSDPDFVSIPVPGNDDSMRAINFMLTRLGDAIEEARQGRPEPAPRPETGDVVGEAPRRGRSRRPPRTGEPGPAAPSPESRREMVGTSLTTEAPPAVVGEPPPPYAPAQG